MTQTMKTTISSIADTTIWEECSHTWPGCGDEFLCESNLPFVHTNQALADSSSIINPTKFVNKLNVWETSNIVTFTLKPTPEGLVASRPVCYVKYIFRKKEKGVTLKIFLDHYISLFWLRPKAKLNHFIWQYEIILLGEIHWIFSCEQIFCEPASFATTTSWHKLFCRLCFVLHHSLSFGSTFDGHDVLIYLNYAIKYSWHTILL